MPGLNTDVGNRYRLLARLGAGGMGTVYSALDRLSRETVALKCVTAAVTVEKVRTLTPDDGLPTVGVNEPRAGVTPASKTPTTASDHFALLSLASEFQVLSSLRHPNIISVLDYGFDTDRRPFYTMELLTQPLTLLQAARRTSLEGRVELLAQMLRALSYLHRRGIVHRDLKPNNVLVSGQVKVLDFGLAISQAEYTGEVAGTLTHIAPEILAHQLPSKASDLYAVGIMAFQMFAGVHPFKKATRSELMHHHLHTEPDFSILPVSEELVQVIRRLLNKDPAQRWSSADEVIEALSDAVGTRIPLETRATRESFLQAAEFVDRAEEKALLVAALARARAGRGSLWLLEGDSGLGKSRLLEHLREVALVQGVTVVLGQASKHQAAHHIWREPLRRLALGTPLSDVEGGTLKILVPDLDTLVERRLPAITLEPQQAKEQMLAVIRTIFERQTQPLLVVLEDIHWALESLDVLNELSEVLNRIPVLILASYRGEDAPGLSDLVKNARLLRLSPLESRDISDLARSMLGSKGEGREIVEFLARHTEGNVFFIVETVRALAEEAGELSKVAEGELPEHLLAHGIQSLVRRRISLVPEDHYPLLERAAVMGPEPDWPILEALLGGPAVSAGRAVCADLNLFEVRHNVWRFSHDKFPEAVVESLDPGRERHLHAEVGKAMEAAYGAAEDKAPALAHHFQMCGDSVKEARYSALAGRAALQKGAYREAAGFLEQALDVQRNLATRDAKAELEILLHLGSVMIALRGWSSPEVKRTYDEAIELGKEVGREAEVAPALIGLSKFFFLRGELAVSRNLALRCLELVEASSDPVIRQHGRLMVGETTVWLGEFSKDRGYAEEIAQLYDVGQIPVHLSLYGQDPRLTSMVSSTVGTWMLGYPDRALNLSRESQALARWEKNPFSEAIVSQICGWIHQLRGDVPETLTHARELHALSSRHGFPPFEVLAQALEGWALARQGQPRKGIIQIRRAIQTWQSLGAELALTYYTTLLADACLRGRLAEEGLLAVNEALRGGLHTQERCYHAELHRLEGELRRQQGDDVGAAASFEAALHAAVEQDAKSFELRAATSRAQLWQGSEKAQEGGLYLASLCAWFSDKGETPDLKAAREVLASIGEDRKT